MIFCIFAMMTLPGLYQRRNIFRQSLTIFSLLFLVLVRFAWHPIALDAWWSTHAWSRIWPSLTITWTMTPQTYFYFHATLSGKSSAFRLSGPPASWIYRQGFDLKVYRFAWKELAGLLPLLTQKRSTTLLSPLPPLPLKTLVFPLHDHRVHLAFTEDTHGYHGTGQWHTYPFHLAYSHQRRWSFGCQNIDLRLNGTPSTIQGAWQKKKFLVDYTDLQAITVHSFWANGTVSYTSCQKKSTVTGTFTPAAQALTPFNIGPYLRIPAVKFSTPLHLVLKKTSSTPWMGHIQTHICQGNLDINLKPIQADTLKIYNISGPLSYDIFQQTLKLSHLTGVSHALHLKDIQGQWSPRHTHLAFTVAGPLKGAVSLLKLWGVTPPKTLKLHGDQTTTGIFQMKDTTPDIQLTGHSTPVQVEYAPYLGHCTRAQWHITKHDVQVAAHWKKDDLDLQSHWHQMFHNPYGTLKIQGKTHPTSPLRSKIRLTFGKNITGFFQWDTLHIKTFDLGLTPLTLETLQGQWQDYRVTTPPPPTTATSQKKTQDLQILFHHPGHTSGRFQWHNFPHIDTGHIMLNLPYVRIKKSTQPYTLPTSFHLPRGKITAHIHTIFQDNAPLLKDVSIEYTHAKTLTAALSGYSHTTPKKKSILTHSALGRWEIHLHGLQLGTSHKDASQFHLLAHKDSRNYYHGSWSLRDYPLKTGSFFNRFVNMITPLGWIQSMSTSSEIKSRFILKNTGTGHLSQGSLKTADLNASFQGDLSLSHLNLRGYATPINVINTVLTWTPLRWWTGKRGLFSASFAVRGTPQKPVFTLNPFSGFAPQFLKSKD